MISKTFQPGSAKETAVSRIGQHRQVVIPKGIFDELHLREGDLMEVTAERGRVAMKPTRVDQDDVLTPAEAQKVRRALRQVKSGKTRPWAQIKHELGL